MAIICIDVKDSTIIELANGIQGETPVSVANLVGIWRERDLDNRASEYPSKEELNQLISNRTTLAKDMLEEALEIKEEPSLNGGLSQIDLDFDPLTRRDRVTLISRRFSNELDKAEIEASNNLKSRIEGSTSEFDKAELESELASLDRRGVIDRYTPAGIFNRVKSMFSSYLEGSMEDRLAMELQAINSNEDFSEYSSEEKFEGAKKEAEYKTDAYQRIINNFSELAKEASNTLVYTEGIRIDPSYKSTNDVNFNESTPEGESELDNRTSLPNNEESVKDGWMTYYKHVSPHESISQDVRKAIRNIQRLDNEGYVETDDLGYPKYLDAEYVHATLMNNLSNMTEAGDMSILLDKLVKTKPWVSGIIDLLNANDNLYSQFYSDFRKDFTQYWVLKSVTENGNSIIQTIPVNKLQGVGALLEEWRYNYEEGTSLDKDSIYNSNREINKTNVIKGLDIVNNLINTFNNTNIDDRLELLNNEDIFSNITKSMRMLGISVNPFTLKIGLTTESNESVAPINMLLSQLSTVYNGLKKENIGNKDLINHFNKAYHSIAKLISDTSEEALESSVRENNKSYYAHLTPSYLGKTIKQLKNSMQDTTRFQKYMLNEYKQYDWFYRDGEWLNDWLAQLDKDSSARESLDHKVVLNFNKAEYSNWDSLDYTQVMLEEYLSDPNENLAYYHVPILSDAPSAEFIKFKRYTSGKITAKDGHKMSYDEILTDKFINLIRQEIHRIDLVVDRESELKNNPNLRAIENYDIVRDKEGNITNNGGAEFKFLPELNYIKYDTGESFLQVFNRLSKEDGNVLNSFLKDTISYIMDLKYKKALTVWNNNGLLEMKDGKYVKYPSYTQDIFDSKLREYLWNSTFASSQIIQILSTDLAFYKNVEDFQKRFKEVHAPAIRGNTRAKYKGDIIGREIEKTVYLKDEKITSTAFKDIEKALNYKVEEGILSKETKDDILAQFKDINVTDAQAYRSVSSYRAVLGMFGKWTDKMQDSYDNFQRGTWNAEDFNTIWQPLKPFVYTQVNNDSGINGRTGIKTPVQHKNAEYLLLAAHQLIAGPLYSSEKLRALNDFMEDNAIDVIQFESAVKVGKQGIIDINSIQGYNNIKKSLYNQTRTLSPKGSITREENPNVIHKVSYEDYGIQQPVPEHATDSEQLIGTQLRKLITADISDDAIIQVGNKNLSKQEFLDLYNSITSENVIQSFKNVSEMFSSKKAIEQALLQEIRGNQRYGIEMIDAITLNDKGNFRIPLSEPSQSQMLQTLLNSIIKNRITKQKTKGGTVVQVSNYGLTKDLNIVFSEDGKSIKYLECYMPWYTMRYLSPLMDPNTHTIDINEVPEDLRELIGYRIPTEDKYSMTPLYIKGFLPRQSGSSIMLPADITLLSGSDFDVDKLYIIIPEFKVNNAYNKNKFADDIIQEYYREKKISKGDRANIRKNIIEAINTGKTASEGTTEYNIYQRWKSDKSKYRDVNSDTISKIKYDFTKSPEENGLQARNNLIMDMMRGVLTNPDTTHKILNPGGFDYQKKAARISTILHNANPNELMRSLSVSNAEDIFPILNSMSLKNLNSLTDEYKTQLDPLSPVTQIFLHQQNMTGAKLIGIYANHNASHALIQHTNVSIHETLGAVKLNSKRLLSLHDITNELGEYISRNNAGFLAASVDNVKDPVLLALNQNALTADASMLLSRSGYTPIEIGLLMTQPIVLEITNNYFKQVRNGINRDTIIENIIKEYRTKAKLNSNATYNEYYSHDFTTSELAVNIINSNILDSFTEDKATKYYENQVAAGLLFQRVIKTADTLGQLTQLMKDGESGPTIADTKIKIQRVEDYTTETIKNDFPLLNAEIIQEGLNTNIGLNEIRKSVLKSQSPYLQATYTLGVQATEDMLSKFFPQFTSSFNSVIDTLRAHTKRGVLDVKTMNSIYNDLFVYIMSKDSFFGADNYISSSNKRREFINEFPTKFNDIILNNPDIAQLEFIKRLIISRIKDTNIPILIFKNVGKLTPNLKEKYSRDWASLLYMPNPIANKLALDLVLYSYYRNGFSFGPNTFNHLMPLVVKEVIPRYIDTINNLINTKDNYSEFIDQYIYNHLDNTKLVPVLPQSSSIKFTNEKGEIQDTLILENDDLRNQDNRGMLISVDMKNGTYIPFRYISTYINYNKVYYKRDDNTLLSDSNVKYERIYPLGLKDNFIEYEYGVDVSEMNSSINRNSKIDSDIEITQDESPFIEDSTRLSDSEIAEQAYKIVNNGENLAIQIKEDLDLNNYEPNIDYRINGDPIC